MRNTAFCPLKIWKSNITEGLSDLFRNGNSTRAWMLILITSQLLLFPVRILKASDIKLLGDEPIIFVDGNKQSGSVTICLRNDSRQKVNLLLTSKNITSLVTKNKVPGKIQLRKIKSDTFLSLLKTSIDPDSDLIVEVEVSSFSGAGESVSTLCNGRDTLTTIHIINMGFPFKLSLEAANPASPEIVIRKGKPAQVILKNEDAMTYLIDCSINIPESNLFVTDSLIRCPGNSNTRITFDIQQDIFNSWLSCQFRDEEKEGQVILRYRASGTIDYPVPGKVIPVKIKMQYFSDADKYRRSSFIILLVLFLGGGVSCILNIWIPNKSRRAELLKQINELALKTRAISMYVDSDLRVGVRVERIRLSEVIKSVNAFNPGSLILLDGVKNRVDVLGQRIEIILQLDNVSHLFDNYKGQASGAPARRMDQVKKLLDQATESLKLLLPDAKDLASAAEKTKLAEGKLRDLLFTDAAFATELSQSVSKLADIYREIGDKGSRKYTELKVRLQDLFSLLNQQNADKFKDPANIGPEHYHWLSSTIERLFVLRHYITTWDSYPERQEEMSKCESSFLQQLNNRTWSSLEKARQFRLEFEENVFAERIQKAIQAKAFKVDISPTNQPRQNERVVIEILFDDAELNFSSARNEFRCEWNFKGVGVERGWKIAHYFRKDAETKYELAFYDPQGSEIKLEKNSDFPGKNEIRLLKDKEEIYHGQGWIELLKFGIAFFIAIIALFTGAKDQILKLDLISGMIAVFLLGFGADAIKNYMTKSPQKT